MDTFDLGRYPLISGYHSLGFLNHTRPDVVWLDYVRNEYWRLEHGYNQLETCDVIEKSIDDGLSKGRSVALLIFDEELLPPPFYNFTNLCNKYRDENFYLITQLPPAVQKIYTFQGGLECKILEIPWLYLNDIFGFYHVCSKLPSTKINPVSKYLCMVGRRDQHKTDLIKSLCAKNLDKFGDIFVDDPKSYPTNFQSIVKKNQLPYYESISKEHDKMAAQMEVDNIWISANVDNFINIQATQSAPLIIHAETTTGLFLPSEKSLWPALLGRHYLIYGQPGIMSFIQRFHDLDQTLYCDTRFDGLECSWTKKSHLDRLDMMLDTNQYLIMHAHEIWNDLRDQIEKSRWTIGYNVLDFCLKQLQKIPLKATT